MLGGLLPRWLWAALALLLAAAGVPAQDVLPVPPLAGRVIDQTNTLTEPQRAALTQKLAALEEQTGTQLVVLMVPTTQPEDIAAYAQRVGDQWKIGRATVGDGLIIVVAKNDRKVRIEVAKTLEGAIPDLANKRIITEQISPAFKAGDFAGGLNAAVDRLAARIRGEALPAPAAGAKRGSAGDDGPSSWWSQYAMFFFVGVPIIGAVLTAMMGRKLGSVATSGAAGVLGWVLTSSLLMGAGAAVLAMLLVGVLGVGAARRGGGVGGALAGGSPVIWGGGGFGGGGFGGGGGGGGFSSGGGGDFGGGGASGDW